MRTRSTINVINVSTHEVKEDGMIQYTKLGGGIFRLEHPIREVKPGTVFWAFPYEIPKAFRDIIVPVHPTDITDDSTILLKKQKEVDTIAMETTKYTKQLRSLGWYDVVDANGKAINKEALRSAAADELLNTLL